MHYFFVFSELFFIPMVRTELSGDIAIIDEICVLG